jgi:hypothetical protein
MIFKKRENQISRFESRTETFLWLEKNLVYKKNENLFFQKIFHKYEEEFLNRKLVTVTVSEFSSYLKFLPILTNPELIVEKRKSSEGIIYSNIELDS